MRYLGIAAGLAILLSTPAGLAQDKGKVVEEIVARVNNDIITLTDYRKAEASLHDEVAQDCPTCTKQMLADNFEKRQKDLLRALIDQALLVQRAKDMGLSVETELVKRLDQLRTQNNLPSMEALEKAVESTGVSWEEYRTTLRNNLLTQEVVRKEVGSRVNVDNEDVKKYYEEHKSEFNRPEQVYLGEILISTDGKSDAELPALEKRANDLLNRVRKGEDFAEMARHYSDGSTAKQGGELGMFEAGQLAKPIEDLVFKLNRGEMTNVIRTKSGFEFFYVEQHYQAGLQPLDKVQNEINQKLFAEKMEPQVRDFLAELREQSYMMIKPGYTDSAAVSGNTVIEEVSPTPDTDKKHKKKKKTNANG